MHHWAYWPGKHKKPETKVGVAIRENNVGPYRVTSVCSLFKPVDIHSEFKRRGKELENQEDLDDDILKR